MSIGRQVRVWVKCDTCGAESHGPTVAKARRGASERQWQRDGDKDICIKCSGADAVVKAPKDGEYDYEGACAAQEADQPGLNGCYGCMRCRAGDHSSCHGCSCPCCYRDDYSRTDCPDSCRQ